MGCFGCFFKSVLLLSVCQQELDGPREVGRGGGGKGGLEGGWRAVTQDAGTMCLPKGLNTVFSKAHCSEKKKNKTCSVTLHSQRVDLT